MSRIRPLAPEEVSQDSRQIFEAFLKQRGNVPNMFRTLAHRPELLETAYKHFSTILNTGTVDIRLKEMVGVRVSQLNQCEY